MMPVMAMVLVMRVIRVPGPMRVVMRMVRTMVMVVVVVWPVSRHPVPSRPASH